MLDEGQLTLNSTIQGMHGPISLRDWIGVPDDMVRQFQTMLIPKITIIGETLPEVWERAVLATWFYGCDLETQYDKPEDSPSKDCTMMMVINNPLREPMIHKAMPGGIEDLAKYQLEVLEGIHDDWIDLYNSQKWQYTYHHRIMNYPGVEQESINQLDYVVRNLAKAPHTRRAQMIIWFPDIDHFTEHPPCLQRMWFRILDDHLMMNVHIRSNDAYKASFMNMFVFAQIQKRVAEMVSERIGREIAIGEYTHIADSFHIYGSYFEDFAGFLNSLQSRSWEDRVYNYSNPGIQAIFEETINKYRK